MTQNAIRAVSLVAFVGSVVGFRLYDRATLTHVADRIAKMLPSTVSHWALSGLGFVAAIKGRPLTVETALSFGSVLLAIFFVLAGTWLINDIFDKETDKHANASRASARGAVPDSVLWGGGVGLLVLAGAFSATVGRFALAVLGLIVLINVVYSVPPFRLKSHAVTNALCNGSLGACGFLFGASAVLAWPTQFVLVLAAATVVAVTANISYWDLKDAEHDAKSGSDTIVVRFGPERVRKGLMAVLPLTYFLYASLFGVVRWLPAFGVIGAAAVYVLHARRDDYHRLAYELDIVNGVNHVTLAVVYLAG